MSEEKISVITGTDSIELKIPKGEDGFELLKLKPLTFASLEELENLIGAPVGEWDEKLSSIKNMLSVVYVGIKQVCPRVTREEVGSWFSMGNIEEAAKIMTQIMNHSGLNQTESAEGNVPVPVKPAG